MIKLRIATPNDGAALADIYRYYVTDTTVSFEYEAPSAEEFSQRIAHKLEKHPYIVAELDGKPIGYAYASDFRERAAYAWDTELSVYVAREMQHAGVGKLLYSALIRILRAQNFVNLYAWITKPNPSSEAFHVNMGFEKICDIPVTGYKMGKWHGISWYQMCIGDYSNPKPIIPFPMLDKGEVERLINGTSDA